MNTPFFIAKRFQFQSTGKGRMSRPAVRVATTGIAVGLAVMLIAVAVVVGFKTEVRNQIIGFGSHIQVMSYSGFSGLEQSPITVTDDLEERLHNISGIKAVQHVVQKPAIIKTDTDFQGVVLKGVDTTYNWEFFANNMVQGHRLTWENDEIGNGTILSSQLAKLLKLNVGDSFTAYFVQERVRARRLVVTGIYETNFADYDKLYLLTDIRLLQQIHGWEPEQVSNIEILIDDYDDLDLIANSVFFSVANRFDNKGQMLQSKTIQELSPMMFEWLDMLDVNALVILVLMLLVSGFLMISGLLILILERTSDIGILKAMGATNWTIRKVFLYQSAFLIGKGMFWGNVVGLLFIALQNYFHIIPLDAAIYYVKWVPVHLTLLAWLSINLGSALLSLLMLVAPSYLITRISPVKAMRFD